MFESFFQEMNQIYPGISRSDCEEAVLFALVKTTNNLWKIVSQQRNEIKGIEEAQTKVNEYVETLEKAKTLADELASVEFELKINSCSD